MAPSLLTERMGGTTLGRRAVDLVWEMLADQRPKKILEFGSGLSTLLFGLANRELDLGAQVISVEHNPRFLEGTLAALRETGLAPEVTNLYAPLRPVLVAGRVYLAYSPHVIEAIRGFGAQFVLVDGPQGQYRRDGTLLIARGAVAPGATVLQDDADRPLDRTALSVWREAFGQDLEVERHLDERLGMAVFTLPSAELVCHWGPLVTARTAASAAWALRGTVRRRVTFRRGSRRFAPGR